MLHHRTEDPAQRAADIAERAEDVAYRTIGPETYPRVWLQTYYEVLEEFAGDERFIEPVQEEA